MDMPLRVAVIGTGMGRYHMQDFAKCPNVKLAAVCDLNKEEALQFAKEYGADKVVTDYHDLWGVANLDAISIAVPNFMHAQIAVEALERGLHVYCEKPMATTLADAKKMVETAKAQNKRLMVGMSQRFKPENLSLHGLVERGELGDIYYARTTWIRRRGVPVIHFSSGGSMGRGAWFVDRAKAGAGALFDIGVHMFDLTWWMMGNPRPLTVSAASYRNLWNDEFAKRGIKYDIDELSSAFVRFENGVAAAFDVSWAANQDNEINVRIFGTQAGFQVYPPKVFSEPRWGELHTDAVEIKEVEAGEGLNPRRHFIDCIRDPAASMIASGEECLTVMAVLDAIQRSAELGREVEVDLN
ncbi:MAG: Gfo/Idh/MocA family oxidoreductase [Anaerolineae bacterium]|nr:Gfo/Idh/MocA family oxidoreductase [Anaerolineae bacterium]